MEEKYRKRLEEFAAAKQKFWTEEYPNKRLEQKISFFLKNEDEYCLYSG